MYIILIVIHVIVCLVLISTILLQAGRGGGLTEMAGGDNMQSFLGTQAPVLLKKATTASAIAFMVTSLLLGMITARRGKSVFDKVQFPTIPQQTGTSGTIPQSIPLEDIAPIQDDAPRSATEDQPVPEEPSVQ